MPQLEIMRELPALETAALLELWVLDATEVGGGFLYFYPGVKEAANEPVVWQAITYQPLPCEVRGLEFKGEGSPPRPSIVFGNVGGTFSGLAVAFHDLVGARVYRKRVFSRYLDGQPAANPAMGLPDDIFFIERKVAETRFSVEFELGTNMDLEDSGVPARLIFANLCSWVYRGEGCGFAGNTAIADVYDNLAPTGLTVRGAWSAGTVYHAKDVVYTLTVMGLRRYYWCAEDNAGAGISGAAFFPPIAPGFWTADECSRRLYGCELRFKAEPTGLPFGGFPASARLSS